MVLIIKWCLEAKYQPSLLRELKWSLGIDVPNQEMSGFLLSWRMRICSVQTRKSDASNCDKIQLFNENKDMS